MTFLQTLQGNSGHLKSMVLSPWFQLKVMMRALSHDVSAMSFQNNCFMAVSTLMTSDMHFVVVDSAVANWRSIHRCQESHYIHTLHLLASQDPVYTYRQHLMHILHPANHHGHPIVVSCSPIWKVQVSRIAACGDCGHHQDS
jgi:hypothetical protein